MADLSWHCVMIWPSVLHSVFSCAIFSLRGPCCKPRRRVKPNTGASASPSGRRRPAAASSCQPLRSVDLVSSCTRSWPLVYRHRRMITDVRAFATQAPSGCVVAVAPCSHLSSSLLDACADGAYTCVRWRPPTAVSCRLVPCDVPLGRPLRCGASADRWGTRMNLRQHERWPS